MDRSHSVRSDDSTAQFASVWRWYTRSQLFIVVLWGAVFLGSLVGVIPPQTSVPLVVVPTIGWLLLAYLKVRCPRCNSSVLASWAYDWFYLAGGECRHCGTMLRRRRFPPETQKKIATILLIILLAIFVVGIAIAIRNGSISITHQHLVVPG